MSLRTLHELLDDQLRLPPETRDQLTSHLPMALQALHSLGASDDRMRAFATTYLRRFETTGTAAPGTPVDHWRALRGRDDAWPALHASFAAALARDGEEAVLRAALPDLLSGVAAAAFHGVIRTAHAIEAMHRGELAAALAYWAWRWQPLAPPRATSTPALAFDDWAAQLIAGARGWTTEGRLISLRIGAATAAEPYHAFAGRLAPTPDLLPRLAALAVGRYAETRNFTVLHMVTGLRALRIVLPRVADPTPLLPGLVHAFTAAYLAARVGPETSSPAARTPAWDAVIAAAIAQDDDHVIKIVHACREEAAAYGPGRYLEAAALAVS